MEDSVSIGVQGATNSSVGAIPEILMMLIAALIVGGALYWVFKRLKKEERLIREKGEYELREFITGNEKDCFNHLKKLFPEYHICPQVSMGALLNPRNQDGVDSNSEEARSRYMILRNKITSKVVDFVFIDKNFIPVFIIELDDKSHDNKLEQDAQRDLNFRLAGLDTVRFRRESGKFPTRKEIEKMLKEQNM